MLNEVYNLIKKIKHQRIKNMYTSFPKKGIYRSHIYFPTYCLIQALTSSDVGVTRGWIFKCLKI